MTMLTTHNVEENEATTWWAGRSRDSGRAGTLPSPPCSWPGSGCACKPRKPVGGDKVWCTQKHDGDIVVVFRLNIIRNMWKVPCDSQYHTAVPTRHNCTQSDQRSAHSGRKIRPLGPVTILVVKVFLNFLSLSHLNCLDTHSLWIFVVQPDFAWRHERGVYSSNQNWIS